MISYFDILPEDIKRYIYCLVKNLKKHDNIVRFINNNFEYQYYSHYFLEQELIWSKLKVSRRKLYHKGVLVDYRRYTYYQMGDACKLENIRASLGSLSYILNSVDVIETTVELYDDYLSCIKASVLLSHE